VRAVLDPNILISALLSPTGAPARTLLAWRDGRFELIVSPKLLDEFERALAYPKLRKRVAADQAASALAWIAGAATMAQDAPNPPARTTDPDDDYLVALAEQERAALVSGDMHILDLQGQLPIFSAADFLDWLQRSTDDPR
jgi:uncharacterized protein